MNCCPEATILTAFGSAGAWLAGWAPDAELQAAAAERHDEQGTGEDGSREEAGHRGHSLSVGAWLTGQAAAPALTGPVKRATIERAIDSGLP